MTERIQRSYELPCSPDELLAGLAQPDVVQRRSDADGLGTRILKHEVSDDAVRIVVSTDVPLDWLAVRDHLPARRYPDGRADGGVDALPGGAAQPADLRVRRPSGHLSRQRVLSPTPPAAAWTPT